MELWTGWTHLLDAALALVAAQLGLSEALAIIVFTLLAKLALMPVSLTAAYRAQVGKEAMARLKPQLDALRERLKDRPAELATATFALYREHGISVVDKFTWLNLASQTVFGLGLFQSLKRTVFTSRFLWIASLSKPDVLLTLLVSVLMVAGMALMPGATANPSMLWMMAVAVVVSAIAVAALPSALGVYWATSNAVTVVQTLALRGLMSRQRRLATTR